MDDHVQDVPRCLEKVPDPSTHLHGPDQDKRLEDERKHADDENKRMMKINMNGGQSKDPLHHQTPPIPANLHRPGCFDDHLEGMIGLTKAWGWR